MPNVTDSVVVAFKHHIDEIYHNRLTDTPPAGLNLFALTRNTPAQTLADKGAHAPAPHAPAPHKDGSDKSTVVESSTTSPEVIAKQKLAQDAAMTNPAEMRKVFPPGFKDATHDPKDQIEIASIDQVFKNPYVTK